MSFKDMISKSKRTGQLTVHVSGAGVASLDPNELVASNAFKRQADAIREWSVDKKAFASSLDIKVKKVG